MRRRRLDGRWRPAIAVCGAVSVSGFVGPVTLGPASQTHRHRRDVMRQWSVMPDEGLEVQASPRSRRSSAKQQQKQQQEEQQRRQAGDTGATGGATG